MKPAIQFAVSAIALAALLGAAGSHATNVAKLPLKASVLAQPNVIVGFDDSGSMDLELMLNSNDGVYWWDHTNGLGYDASGNLFRRIGGNSSDQWRRYVYLFPNGQGGGLNLKGLASQQEYSVPPTTDLAYLRSSDWNPQYYNPNVTYRNWGSADTYPASSFPPASPTAARGHPLYGGSGNTFNLTATRTLNTNSDRYFIALKGMTLPAGAKYQECSNTSATSGCASSWTDVGTTDRAANASKTTRLAMDYWPATYWVKAQGAWDCTLPAVKKVGVDDCALAPDGSKLRRIEIKPAVTSYPGKGRNYTDELQNFANWFQYHRKRRLSANAAMSEVLENLTGLNMGIVRMNDRGAAIAMKDLNAPLSANNGQSIVKFVYEIDTNVGTPTRETLKRIGDEFTATSNNPIKFACQRNAALIVTDGYAQAGTVNPPAYSSGYSKSTYGSGAPYDTTYGGTLADLALYYYTNPLRPASAAFPLGQVQTSVKDPNSNLHMNTYALTLGAKGNVYDGEGTPPPTLTSAWVDPTANFDPVAVDDLWHATINGRGNMYLATSAAETADKLRTAFNDILSGTGAQGGLAVSTVNLARGDSRAYIGTYDPAGWAGDLRAAGIDKLTGVVEPDPAKAAWSASKLLGLRDWTTRTIVTSTGGNSGATGLAFSAAAVGATVNPGAIYGNTALLIDYLRGDRSNEDTLFRKRISLLGAVINSEPVVSREDGVVYVQSGEGMLHAFDTKAPDAGKELWAFVPNSVLSSIGKTSERNYPFASKLDGPLAIGKIASGKKLLVAGSGSAGRFFHAIDVTDPRGLNEATLAGKVRWQFPAAGDATTQAKVGLALGRPVFVKLADGSSAVLLTSGYNNNDNRGRMWMLKLDASGDIAQTVEFDTGAAASDAGLAQVSAYVGSDDAVRYVYGGDLLGNLWQFDLTNAAATSKLAVLKGPAGDLQPVTSAPELTEIEGKRVVLVGTGRLLDISDFPDNKVQSFYAIAEGTSLASARASSKMMKKTYVPASGGTADDVTGSNPDWKNGDRGWYIDMTAGEQANTRPTLAYGAVAWVTNKNGATDCTASSRLDALNLTSGGKYPPLTYASEVISSTANSSGVTALLTSDGKIVFTGQDADGKPWIRPGTGGAPIAPAKNAWREVRRQ